MILQSLSITGFKNIESAAPEFSHNVNCLLGNNGMGKSNLLDAIYLLSYCRSFTGVADSALIRRGGSFATVAGHYLRRGIDEHIAVAIRPGRRKSFKRGGKEYQRLADHIGLFPLVLVSPADMELTQGEPSERRRFIDQIASQSDARYLDALMRYNAATEQRNRLLRAEAEPDAALFEAIEMQMDAAGSYITRRRAATIGALAEIFAAYYRGIAGGGEVPGLEYRPNGDSPAVEPGDLAARLAARRGRDRILGYTTSGPHRDDIDMTVDGAPVRRVASQGQSKTFTTALRFAQYELLRKSLELNPLLLLDDIFDKLDSRRVASIMSLVADSGAFGQIFITDTNRRHFDEIIAEIPGADSRLWNVGNGTFTPLSL